jgi:hypothetical protein
MMNKYNQVINDIFWRFPSGSAMRCNLLFVSLKRIFTSIPNAKTPAMNHKIRIPELRLKFEEWKLINFRLEITKLLMVIEEKIIKW